MLEGQAQAVAQAVVVVVVAAAAAAAGAEAAAAAAVGPHECGVDRNAACGDGGSGRIRARGTPVS